MIGNDVIDLVQSRKDSNWRRRGFVSKLFNEHEQLLIVNSPDGYNVEVDPSAGHTDPSNKAFFSPTDDLTILL
ncbi:hypothetical protein, partial [Sphingobacterium sp. HSC-15S19]|uniref:hypothetical protein n=1 Tax=Sphingobacterium sp. HSC-15S19 TaxID=2910971 RepID=UPI003D1B2F69